MWSGRFIRVLDRFILVIIIIAVFNVPVSKCSDNILIREDLISNQECLELITQLENCGNAWNRDNDILDGRDMDQLDVFERGWVNSVPIYDMIMNSIHEKVIAAIEDYTSMDLYLYWIFVRRYSPVVGSRDRLKPHRDSNAITVNILLNDNFHGGELYVLHANSSLERSYDDDIIEDEYLAGSEYADYFYRQGMEGRHTGENAAT